MKHAQQSNLTVYLKRIVQNVDGPLPGEVNNWLGKIVQVDEVAAFEYVRRMLELRYVHRTLYCGVRDQAAHTHNRLNSTICMRMMCGSSIYKQTYFVSAFAGAAEQEHKYMFTYFPT